MKIILCGGGTAGHVNPAVAIGEEILRQSPDSSILFVGRQGGKENAAVLSAGIRLETLEVCGLSRKNPIKAIKGIKSAITAQKKAKGIISEFKPDVILGTGGYVCWPIISAGQKMGIKTVIHESNVFPGLSARMVSEHCDLILLNHKESIKHFRNKDKIAVIGNPIRKEFIKYDRKVARKSLGLKESDIFILSFGGSIGAQKLNSVMIEVMNEYTSKHSDMYHIHATGDRYFEESKRKVNFNEKGKAQLTAYVDEMSKYMYAADIVISRCGATTLSELSTVGTAAILVPSPNVTGNHQLKNAKLLEQANAAVVIEENQLSAQRMIFEISSFKNDKNARKTMAKNIKALSDPNSAKKAYIAIKSLINTAK